MALTVALVALSLLVAAGITAAVADRLGALERYTISASDVAGPALQVAAKIDTPLLCSEAA